MKIKNIIFRFLNIIQLPGFFRIFFQKNKVSILLYHQIEPEDFEVQLKFLLKNYHIISLQRYLSALQSKSLDSLPKYALIITFDDGKKQNYELLKIIKKYDVPVTIFLTAGIIGTNRHFWFRYNQKNYSNEFLKTLSNKEKLSILNDLGFDQEKEYLERQALSRSEIMEMSDYVDFQSHTVFHPCLNQCENDESYFEIHKSKEILEKNYNFKINALAYPNGDFTQREIEYAKSCGYSIGLTTIPGFNTSKTNPLKLKRLDTNDTTNLHEFYVKSSGLPTVKYILKSSFRPFK